MKNKQSSDDMMKTPVPTVVLDIDLTSTKPKVIETILTSRRVVLHKPRLNIIDLSIDDNIVNEAPSRIEIDSVSKIKYTIDGDIHDDTLIDLNTVAYTPNQCYNLVINVIDHAPKRTIANAEVLGFSTWGSINVTHWETIVPKRHYSIIRGNYNIYLHNNYIIAWKNSSWLNNIIKTLDRVTETRLGKILNSIFDKVVVVEGYIENSTPGMIVTSTYNNLEKLIADSLTSSISDHRIKVHLEGYLRNSTSAKTLDNGNVFKALEVLQGEKIIMDIITQLLDPCNDIRYEYLRKILVQRLSLDEDLIHKLFAENRKISVNVKCNTSICVIKNEGDIAIVDLIALNPRTNKVVLHIKTLIPENTSLELKHPRIKDVIIKYRLY